MPQLRTHAVPAHHSDTSKLLTNFCKPPLTAEQIAATCTVMSNSGVPNSRAIQKFPASELAYIQASARILRMKQVVVKIGVSRSTIYDWLDLHSKRFNPNFPRPFKLSQTAHGAIGWHEWAIDAWIAARSAEPQ